MSGTFLTDKENSDGGVEPELNDRNISSQKQITDPNKTDAAETQQPINYVKGENILNKRKDKVSAKKTIPSKDNLQETRDGEPRNNRSLEGSKKVLAEKTSGSKKISDDTKESSETLSEESKDTASKLINETVDGKLVKTKTGTTNEEVAQHRHAEASMVSYESGGKAPKNTPAHSIYGSEPDGKVQQMYVRFPGQRHGLMML